jgi:hypothetical protein
VAAAYSSDSCTVDSQLASSLKKNAIEEGMVRNNEIVELLAKNGIFSVFESLLSIGAYFCKAIGLGFVCISSNRASWFLE